MGCNSLFAPDDTVAQLKRYIDERCPVGNFLFAVLCNNLSESFQYADDHNSDNLGNIVAWLWTYAPATCWGSSEKVNTWLRSVK